MEQREKEGEREMENNSSREARRKRILGAGSDRMALITGTIQSLPPTSSQPLISSQDDQINDGVKGDVIDSSLPRNDISDESNTTSDIGSQVIYQEQKQSPPIEKLKKTRLNPLTPKQVSSCILSSEPTRIICSLMIALLVVLSYVDRPLLGRNLVRSESVVASRPFYILLLTDITILLARLSVERRRDTDKEDEKMGPHEEDGHNWACALTVLETGLVVYQSICAVFMDFCVYAVVVICGLSFV